MEEKNVLKDEQLDSVAGGAEEDVQKVVEALKKKKTEMPETPTGKKQPNFF